MMTIVASDAQCTAVGAATPGRGVAPHVGVAGWFPRRESQAGASKMTTASMSHLRMETITRKRGFSAAPGAIAGMVSAIGYLGDRRLWTRENAVLFTDRVLANDSLILAS
jgi:hypothetical protein